MKHKESIFGQSSKATPVRHFYIEPSHTYTGDLCTFLDIRDNAVDISDWTFKLGIVRRGDSDPLVLTNGSGIIVTGSSIQFQLTAEQVDDLGPGVLMYDLRVERPSHNVWYVLTGKMHFQERITR